MKRRQILVIGAGRFGSALATTLYRLGHEVVVVDASEEIVNRVMNDVTHAVIADATSEEALRRLGAGNFDVAVVAIGSDLEANILATVALKELGARRVVSKVTSAMAARVLLRVGADQVVQPEHDMGVRLARQLVTPRLLDAFNLGERHGVIELEADGRLLGRLADLQLPRRFGVQVIAVTRAGTLNVTPGADFVLEPHDQVVLIGDNRGLQRLRDHLGG